MSNLNEKLTHENAILSKQLDMSAAENERLTALLSSNASTKLSNDEIHQFNNIAALLDANIELALDALTRFPQCGESIKPQDISTVTNFIIAAQNAKTELVDIVNA